jgi:hypothetical protein
VHAAWRSVELCASEVVFELVLPGQNTDLVWNQRIGVLTWDGQFCSQSTAALISRAVSSIDLSPFISVNRP